MQIYNLEKLKNKINIELDSIIEEHKKDYLCKLKNYSESYDTKEDYYLYNSSIILHTKIKNKNIKNKENNSMEYKIVSDTKVRYDEFTNCRFENIQFKNCYFEGSAFLNCTFINVIFEDCSFINEKSIVIFKESCTFKGCSFRNCNLKKSIFKQVILDNTKFIKCNLRDSIFSNTQIRSIQISDCDCRGYKVIDSSIEVLDIEDEYITKFDEYTFIDKIIVDKKYLKSYENASKVYRIIANKFENNNLVNYAGEYYYLSKKAESKVLKGLDRIKSRVFCMVCGYGERPAYALITSVEIILLFAIIYMFTGLKVDGVEINYSKNLIEELLFMPNLCRNFSNSLYFSITTFTTVGYGDITPVGGSVFLSGIEMFLGVTMVGLWTATLARKIIR